MDVVGVVQNIILDVNRAEEQVRIQVRRSDALSRVWRFVLVDDGEPVDLKPYYLAVFEMQKGKDTAVSNACVINAKGGYIDYTVTTGTVDTAGSFTASLTLYGGGVADGSAYSRTLGSPTFRVTVYNNSFGADLDQGQSEFDSAAEAAGIAKGAAEDAQAAAKTAGKAAEAAEKAKDAALVSQGYSVALKCSEMGMTTGDDNGNNIELLCRAIDNADTVVVDGMYTLTNIATYSLEKNIRIVGEGVNCGFDLSNAVQTLFTVGEGCYQISVENLILHNSNAENLAVVFRKEKFVAPRMNFVKMDGCHIVGRISPFRFYQSPDLDPSDGNVGVDVISITNNTIRDNRASCFIFEDVSFNTLEVSANIVRNFDNIFVHSGVTNTSQYCKEITQSKKKTLAHNNDVACDDDWYHDENSTSTYYAFVLAEGQSAHYHDNEVVGLKSHKDVALYDAYLSCADVIYENNVWKNNCVLVETANNDLMKAKDSVSADVGTRKYHNNVFIAEKSFYEQHGASGKNCVIHMIDNVTPNSWDVQGNHIEVYRLAGFTSSSKMADLTFKNNVIKTETWVKGSLLAGTNGSEILCEGNTVVCADGTGFSGLVTGSFVSKKCVFCNNVLENCRYPLGSGNAEELIVSDNTFIDDQGVSGRLSSYGKYAQVVGRNNKIVKQNGYFSMFGGGFVAGGDETNGYKSSVADCVVESTFKGPISDGTVVMIHKDMNAGLLIEFDGVVMSGNGKPFKGHVFFTVLDGYVEYTTSQGETVVQKMGSGIRAPLQVITDSGESLPFDVLLNLASEDDNSVVINMSSFSKIMVNTRVLSTDDKYFYVPEDVVLPADYQRLYFIESDGNQYIDTGVLASDHPDGIAYAFDGMITGTNSSVTEYLWGALNSGKRSGNLAVDEGTMWLSLSIGELSDTVAYCGLEVNEYIHLTVSGTSKDPNGVIVYKNGKEGIYSRNERTGSDMPGVNIHFLRVNGSSATAYAMARIYNFKMNNMADGTPIRNFIPCYQESSGVVGLYDTVGGVFYTNQGTGSFERGTEI